MNKEEIFKRNQSWIQKKLERDGSYFDKLSEGQSPGFIYLGCSDSRVVPELFMGLEPGEVFVHRNVANLFHETDLSIMTVLTYAITALNVKDIVVCGHYQCGGVKLAMEGADFEWLAKIKDVCKANPDADFNKMVELNVVQQCTDLEELDLVKDNGVKVHPWVFDLSYEKIVDLGN